MKNFKSLFMLALIMLVLGNGIFAYEDGKTGRAEPIGKGNWQVGLFHPLVYGISEKAEVSTHPLLFIKIPNLYYKRIWLKDENKTISSGHSFVNPTGLLNTLAKEGIGGMISPEFEMPFMLSIYQEMIYSRKLMGQYYTARAGIGFGVSGEELDARTTIDIPLVYNRLATYYGKWQIRLGSDLDGRVTNRISYHLGATLFMTPGIDESIAFEQKTMLTWNKSERFKISTGLMVAYGQYPFGDQWNLIPPRIALLPVWVPLFDLVWSW